MIFRVILQFSQVLAILILISCRPTSKIKDIRKIEGGQAFESYFSLLNIKSPCTVSNDSVSSQSLSLTSSLAVKGIHEKAISQYKKQLPKGLIIKLQSVRNHKKSTYYQYEYFVQGHMVCGQTLRIHFDAAGKMTVVGNLDPKISIKSSYVWDDLDISVLEKQDVISDLDEKEINLLSSDNCLKEKDGKLIEITNLVLFIRGLKYQAEVHKNEVISLDEDYLSLGHAGFSGQGVAKIFDDNIGQETKNFELANLEKDSTYLCSKDFITSKTAEGKFTQSASRNYDFAPGTVEFRDASVFTNAYQTQLLMKS